MADSLIVSPGDDSHHDCPVLTKSRTVLVDKGVCSTILWEMRDRNGTAIDLTSYETCGAADQADCYQIIARISDAVGASSTIHQIIGDIETAADGTVTFDLTDAVVANSGVFHMEIGLSCWESDGVYKLILVNKGLLSVEKGLFGDISSSNGYLGAPTIQEIRMAMRDTAIENELLDAVEFDDAEIVFALQRPIREWNEKPPPVAIFNGGNFPFHEMWLRATMSHLLKTAAYWYERNNLGVSHGGISVKDKDKMSPYMQLAQQLQSEWDDFVITKKVQINAGLAIGSTGTSYGRGY